MINIGIKTIIVTGTCFEFGFKNGPLSPYTKTDPQNPYAKAKDSLRIWLEEKQKLNDFSLKWVRLFYMYGSGQNPNSILSQLERAIKRKEKVFNMSGGEQLRDYLPVSTVAKELINILINKKKIGTLHICSGDPISIRRLVEEHRAKMQSSIKLNLGHYPYSKHEPFAFWGSKKNDDEK